MAKPTASTAAPGARSRPAKAPVAATIAATPARPKRKTSPGQFAKEVRAEARKITWTSRKETWITSVMVFIMVVLAALFFLVVDFGLGFSVQQLLRLAA